MRKIHWVQVEDVLALHDKTIEKSGGSQGLRDQNLLESALARPQNLHAYGEADLFLLAASYAEGIVRNHAFADGNKRSGFTTAVFFLLLNGVKISPRKDDGYADMMVNFAEEKIAKDDVAAYLRENSTKIKS